MIDNASSGDIITIPNGFYEEQIVIDKPLTLVGEEKENTIISGFYNRLIDENNVITVLSDNVNIINLTITSRGYMGSTIDTWLACSGIALKLSKNCKIENNLFYDLGGWRGGWNILVLKGENTTIISNTIIGTTGKGIIMDSSNNSVIKDNNITFNSKYGVWLSSSSGVNISNNSLNKNKFALILVKSDFNEIYGNDFKHNNKKGICVKRSNNNIISHNNFVKKFFTKEEGETKSVSLKILKSNNQWEASNINTYTIDYRLDEYGEIEIIDGIEEILEFGNIDISSFLLDLKVYLKQNLSNYFHANFFYCKDNCWDYNYWVRYIFYLGFLGQKIIVGKMNENEIHYIHTRFDRHPLEEPFDKY